MKKYLHAASAVALAVCAANASAFTQETHKRIVIDAVSYMAANPETTNYNRLKAAAEAAGYTIDEFANAVGQGAYDVDDFEDTYICGAITGDCVQAPVWGIGSFVATYTAWWHFQNHSRGADVHGNDIGGYNYDLMPNPGLEDNMLAGWLNSDHLDDGRGGMRGWFGREDSEYNSYGVTEANYRLESYSSKDMYEDFEEAAFQPIDNLGQYWYNQFWDQPSAQTLGFALHTTDLLQPHHTWVTSAHSHGGWEAWVADYYDSENLNDSGLVETALLDITPPVPGNREIRGTLTEGGAYSYQNGGIVLSSNDHGDRVEVAKKMIPHAIAMTVHILNHAADRF
ncbi:phospholipase [Parendozoicomonas sp. Alg238-R29]|uniref:phospholipase n=1 Tax=Parendozoicomonas sp. Alg238-R29 TaxID=2993446 RepID=UPI00248D9228|nr:phospholipase [Parendozoicomonas sp. Alg238-R29]